jgi:hypothetical protein
LRQESSFPASDTKKPFALRLQEAVAYGSNVTGKYAWLTSARFATTSIIIFSIFYFAETCIRASEKTFWFDEICTLEVCKFPTFHETWNAVIHGSDFNPPLFYLIQRSGMALFGDGLIGMRLPQMIAFWILCLCLFWFVNRRVGLLGGIVAMLIPRLTLAYFYAYEARPHALVLGFCGLALVCWQMSEERGRRWPWLLAFAVALDCAFFTHCYSILLIVPFGMAELFRAVRSRVIDTRKSAVLILAPLVAIICYVPLLKSYQHNLGSPFTSKFLPNLSAFFSFYPNLLDMSVLVVLLAVVLFALERSGSWLGPDSNWANSIPMFSADVIVVVTFLSLPAIGILLARMIHGPFFARYFTSAVVAVCIALGIGVGSRPRSRSSWILTGFIACLIAKSMLTLAWHKLHSTPEILYEPSSGIRLNMDGLNALRIHPLLRMASVSALPVLVPHVLDYKYLMHYVPTQARQYSTVGVFDMNEGLGRFLPSHKHFLVYALANEDCYRLLSKIIDRGGALNSLKLDDYGHFLAEVQMPAGAATSR